MAEVLPIPYAFHSPLAQPIYEGFREFLKAAVIKPAQIPCYSCITGKLYPESVEEARTLLSEQIIKTVVFEPTIQKMYEDGAKIFIEVGPRNILSNFVKQILQDKVYSTISSNHHLRPGMTQLNHVLALLAAHHIPFTLEKLYRD
jgi:acyl transferase domain-containing protein